MKGLHTKALLLVAILTVAAGCGGRRGQPKADVRAEGDQGQVKICWMKGPAAVALESLARTYREETGVDVSIAKISRAEFHDQVVLHLEKKATEFDIVIGRAHWLSENVEAGNYVDLSDFLKREVSMTRKMHPRLRELLCEYPRNSGNYFAAPCYPDPMGLAYRQDWFADPVERSAFRDKYGYELEPPRTWHQLRDIASFFHRPADSRYGIVMLTGREFNGLAYSFQQIFYSLGGSFADPESNQVKGYLNSGQASDAVTLMKDVVATGPEGAEDADANDVVTTFIKGETAMSISFFSAFPGISSVMGDTVAFAPVPAGEQAGRVTVLEGYGMSISTKIPEESKERALEFMRWFLSAETQDKWVKLVATTFDVDHLADANFLASAPHLRAYADSLDGAQSYWNVPVYVPLTRHIQKYVGDAIDGYLEPEKALDDLAEECAAVLRDEGLLMQY